MTTDSLSLEIYASMMNQNSAFSLVLVDDIVNRLRVKKSVISSYNTYTSLFPPSCPAGVRPEIPLLYPCSSSEASVSSILVNCVPVPSPRSVRAASPFLLRLDNELLDA